MRIETLDKETRFGGFFSFGIDLAHSHSLAHSRTFYKEKVRKGAQRGSAEGAEKCAKVRKGAESAEGKITY